MNCDQCKLNNEDPKMFGSVPPEYSEPKKVRLYSVRVKGAKMDLCERHFRNLCRWLKSINKESLLIFTEKESEERGSI